MPHRTLPLALLAVLTLAPALPAQTSYPMLMSLQPIAVQVGQSAEVAINSRYSMHGTYQVSVTGQGVTGEVVTPMDLKPGEKAPNLQKITVRFTEDAIAEIARIAADVNGRSQNIGARRLHTVMERLLDELSFSASDIGPQEIVITEAYVRERLGDVVKNEDLSKYIL